MASPDIVNIIASVGFPIVCCGAMFWFINSTMKDVKESIDKLTIAITKIVEKYDD